MYASAGRLKSINALAALVLFPRDAIERHIHPGHAPLEQFSAARVNMPAVRVDTLINASLISVGDDLIKLRVQA